MELTRRTMLSALVLGPALPAHARSRPLRQWWPYDATTAPDPVSAAILANPLTSVTGGLGPGTDARAEVHACFPAIVEQNFAQRDAISVTALTDALTPLEWSHLALLYRAADDDLTGERKLLSVLAHRLDQRRLLRLAQHFDTHELLAAVVAVAPQKADAAFLAAMDAVGARKRQNAAGGSGLGRFLNMTPYEIYLDFRTAPDGALGVGGALWEAATVLSRGVAAAGLTGYEIGQLIVSPLIQNYAPSLHIAIGDAIGPIVDSLFQSWPLSVQSQGDALKNTCPKFDPTLEQHSSFESTGGDFGTAVSWPQSLRIYDGLPFYFDP